MLAGGMVNALFFLADTVRLEPPPGQEVVESARVNR